MKARMIVLGVIALILAVLFVLPIIDPFGARAPNVSLPAPAPTPWLTPTATPWPTAIPAAPTLAPAPEAADEPQGVIGEFLASGPEAMAATATAQAHQAETAAQAAQTKAEETPKGGGIPWWVYAGVIVAGLVATIIGLKRARIITILVLVLVGTILVLVASPVAKLGPRLMKAERQAEEAAAKAAVSQLENKHLRWFIDEALETENIVSKAQQANRTAGMHVVFWLIGFLLGIPAAVIPSKGGFVYAKLLIGLAASGFGLLALVASVSGQVAQTLVLAEIGGPDPLSLAGAVPPMQILKALLLEGSSFLVAVVETAGAFVVALTSGHLLKKLVG